MKLAGALIFACLGSAGCAANDDADPTASITIQAWPVEDISRSVLFIAFESPIELYLPRCDASFEFEKWSGTEWIPLQDDRPAAEAGPGYYLNGAFTPAKPSMVCTDRSCVRHPALPPRRTLQATVAMQTALDYVQVGTKQPPKATAVDDSDAGTLEAAPEVPEIETRLLSGPVQVTYFYYTDENCESPRLEVSDEVTFPAP